MACHSINFAYHSLYSYIMAWTSINSHLESVSFLRDQHTRWLTWAMLYYLRLYTICLVKFITVYAGPLESSHLRDVCLCSVYLKFCTINELCTTINNSIEWTDSSWYKKGYPYIYMYIPVYTSICLYILVFWIISFHVLCISIRGMVYI